MATLPKTVNLLAVQGATFLYDILRVRNRQVITLAGAGTDDWFISLYKTRTVALDRTASEAEVQAALRSLSRVGTSGVTVDSTTPGTDYTLTFGGDLAGVEVPKVELILPADVTGEVSYVPVDWTDWTAVFRIRLNDSTTGLPTGTKALEVDESDDPDTTGGVILGYVAPADPGGVAGTPDLENGHIAISLPASVVATLYTSIAAADKGAAFVLEVQYDGGTKQTLLDGTFRVKVEPQT